MRIVALDGGTSNTRAVLFDDGRPVAESRQPAGVGGQEPIATVVGRCLNELMEIHGLTPAVIDGVVAGGMLTSEVGLCAIPHRTTPIGANDLAADLVEVSLPDIWPRPVWLVPGVRHDLPAPSFGEMMRGEECEIVGLIEAGTIRGPTRIVLAGSHGKWVRLDPSLRIVDIATSMTGELLAAIAGHTLLKVSLGDSIWSAAPDERMVLRGAELARCRGLPSALFQVRCAVTLGGAIAAQAANLLLGIVVGADVRDNRDPTDDTPLVVTGPERLRRTYAQILRSVSDTPVTEVDEATARLAGPAGGAWLLQQRWQSGPVDPRNGSP